MTDFATGIGGLTAEGYQPPYCIQFSCFLPNRVGKLLELVEVFNAPALTLAAISVVDASDHAVVRVVTSNCELARRLLKRHNIAHAEIEVLAVELSHNQTLAEVCSTMLSAEVSIHYAYPMLVRPRRKPVIVLHTDDQILSAQILRRKLMTLLAENDLGDNATGSDPASEQLN